MSFSTSKLILCVVYVYYEQKEINYYICVKYPYRRKRKKCMWYFIGDFLFLTQKRKSV